MNVWKLIRGLSKVTHMSYRSMKKEYAKMNDRQKVEAKKAMVQLWKDYSSILNHKKYYDLKKPLPKSPKVPETVSETAVEAI